MIDEILRWLSRTFRAFTGGNTPAPSRSVSTTVFRVWGGDEARTRALGRAMVDLARADARDPEFVFWAKASVRSVPSKAHHALVRCLLDWVRSVVTYRYDPLGLEWVQSPKHTLTVAGEGDCFVKGTRVLLREGMRIVPVETVRVGDEVWGRDRWSKVENTWERGVKKTWIVLLNNGGSIRFSPEHKVFVAFCQNHERGTIREKLCSCPVSERKVERIVLNELRVHDVLLAPDRVGFGVQQMDPRRAWVEGIYVADGNVHGNQFQIAGRDGFPREQQKKDVQVICSQLGIETRWRFNYIACKDSDWTSRMRAMGTFPWIKHVLSIDLVEETAKETLRGVLADSGRESQTAGRCFTTSSYELLLQTRVLLKMFGITCSSRFIQDHGSTSKYPIWRLGIRADPALDALGTIYDKAWRKTSVKRATGRSPKLLRVREMIRDGVEAECFDVATDDHYVWLPEADLTVSNCDDGTALLAALAVALGYRATIRFVKSDRSRPDEFSHVYVLVGVPDGRGAEEWVALDWTQAHSEPGWQPPFWEKMDLVVA